MDAQITEKLKLLRNQNNVDINNPLWRKYKANCEDQEKFIEEKYKLFYSELRLHQNYTQELAFFINNGYDLNNFPSYFMSKLEYFKFMEIMSMRQNIFKTECLRYRGYNVSDSESLFSTNYFDEGSMNVIAVINSIINSSAKDFIPQKDFESLKETLTRALYYSSLSIKFNLNSKDEELFVNVRKILRNQLLSEELSMYEKAFVRKIVNDIQTLIKLEFQMPKCMEDHDVSSLNVSNVSEESGSNQQSKVKLVRTNVIKDQEEEI